MMKSKLNEPTRPYGFMENNRRSREECLVPIGSFNTPPYVRIHSAIRIVMPLTKGSIAASECRSSLRSI